MHHKVFVFCSFTENTQVLCEWYRYQEMLSLGLKISSTEHKHLIIVKQGGFNNGTLFFKLNNLDK